MELWCWSGGGAVVSSIIEMEGAAVGLSFFVKTFFLPSVEEIGLTFDF